MNGKTLLRPSILAALLYCPAYQAQTPAVRSSSQSAGTDTLNSTTQNAPAPGALPSDSPEATNSIRVVRLSQANGKVEMDRNSGLGFEVAFNNLPITQGAQLITRQGSAEVEFEDGSTLRMIPDTQVNFTHLSRSAAGATISSMNVLRGTVYVSLSKTKGNFFSLTSGDGIIKPRPGTHLRLEVKDPESRLSVVNGTSDFTNTAGSREVGKMRSLIFNTLTHLPADQIAGIEDAPFDTWDGQQAEYHKRYSHGNALAGSGSAYGLADLNYYGSFSNVDGCGRIWRPYFASAAWDPYASGIWAWYTGSGYSWVSPYPWGWAPFHYGSWLQCGGGWGWQPGGGWFGLGNVRDRHWDHDGHHHPHAPIQVHPFPPRPRPVLGKFDSMVAVNQKPLKFSQVDGLTRSFNFRNDSAGLGIPRGEFAKLDKLSETARKDGSSKVPLFIIPADRTDLSPVGSGGLAVREERASGARAGDHDGLFNRPGNQNRDTHNTYAGRIEANLASGRQTDGVNGSAASQGSSSTGTVPGYTGSNQSKASRGSSGDIGHSGANATSGGYSGGPRSTGYSNGVGGYSSGSRSGGGSSSGGGGAYSGGSRAGGGGYSGAGGGGSRASAPTMPSPSSPAPSVPAPAAPSGHK